MLKTLTLAAGLALGGIAPALALAPLPAPDIQASPNPQASVVPVRDGCGPYAFRDRFGYCRPLRPYYRPRLCPPGFHPGPYLARCFPN